MVVMDLIMLVEFLDISMYHASSRDSALPIEVRHSVVLYLEDLASWPSSGELHAAKVTSLKLQPT